MANELSGEGPCNMLPYAPICNKDQKQKATCLARLLGFLLGIVYVAKLLSFVLDNRRVISA